MPDFKREALVNLLFPIVAFLVPIVVYFGYIKLFDSNRHIRLTDAKLSVIKDSLIDFKKDVGRFPTTAEGLQVLVTNDRQATTWKGPYISEDILIDAWNNPFKYGSTEDLTYVGSLGKNKIFDTSSADIKMKHKRGDDILLFIESQ